MICNLIRRARRRLLGDAFLRLAWRADEFRAEASQRGDSSEAAKWARYARTFRSAALSIGGVR